jgi:alkylhydroperoxidase/carboxymuconolactone decarboxylase family protein YurZ
MDEFDVLLSGMPGIKDRFSELKDQVLWNGPLDARSRAVAVVAVTMALNHPTLSEMLIWAKQAGMRNEEISHITAIAAVLRAGGFGSTASANNGNGQQLPPIAGCC